MTSELHRFDRDSAVTEVARDDEGAVFDAHVDDGWWIVAGPNGGYLAAILLRAMGETVGDATREPRTQTTHYTARPEPGPARVVTRVERSGRSLSTVTARLEQHGRLIALSVGALGSERHGERPSFQDDPMPEVAKPAEVPLRVDEGGPAFRFRERYEMRPVFDRGSPGGGHDDADAGEALTGGWIRLAGERPLDALAVTALADAWPPALFQKLGRWQGGQGVPTVELTTHFRAPDHAARLAAGSWCLVRFQTRTARGGFIEEDGEIWSEDGTLLAQSRQLALLA